MSQTYEEDIERVWDAMEHIKIAMLITETPQGPRARPMTAILHREQGLIWFLSGGHSSKEYEIEHDRLVCLTFSDGVRTQVAVTGQAAILHDPAVVRKLWSPQAEAFLPSGPDDPSIAAIRVIPHVVELWEGESRLANIARIAASLVGGEPAADPGDHVQLGTFDGPTRH